MTKREDLVYRTYSTYLEETYGEKVYKVPLTLPTSCPNRDGRLGTDACLFCGDEGGSFEGLDAGNLAEQFAQNAARIQKKYGHRKYLAYFQRFTNTYMPPEALEDVLSQVAQLPVEGVILATRPDCLPEEILDVLERFHQTLPVTLEMGLQSANAHSLMRVGRGHGVATFVDGVLRAKKRGFRVCTHLILNLPGDDELDVKEGALLCNALEVDEVKLHALYIVEGTGLGELYRQGRLDVGTEASYQERVILFLRHLHPEIVVQRIIGRAPEEGTLFVNWNKSWWRIRDEIVDEMIAKGYRQGDLVQEPLGFVKNSLKSDENSI